MEEKLLALQIGKFEFFGDTTYVIRTGETSWSVCDNGEEVAGCDLATAIRIITENIS